MGTKLKQLELHQLHLKVQVKKLKKRIPYVIMAVIFLTIIFILLFEESVSGYFGNSLNVLYACGIFNILIIIPYWLITKRKIKKRVLESKEISTQMYDLMKLQN